MLQLATRNPFQVFSFFGQLPSTGYLIPIQQVRFPSPPEKREHMGRMSKHGTKSDISIRFYVYLPGRLIKIPWTIPYNIQDVHLRDH